MQVLDETFESCGRRNDGVFDFLPLGDLAGEDAVIFLPAKLQKIDRDLDGKAAAVLGAVERFGGEALELFHLLPVGRPVCGIERDVNLLDRRREQLVAAKAEIVASRIIHVTKAAIGGNPEGVTLILTPIIANCVSARHCREP